MRVFEGWAPPGSLWGPWVEIASQLGGPFTFKVDFYTISEAESAFEAEIKYWRGSELRSDFANGPGSHTFTAGICGCVSRIRFRSYTLGQIIKITLS